MSIEGILANIGVIDILNKLVPVVSQEINLAWGVKDDLKKLQHTLEMVLAVIADAERRQVTEKAVGLWLRRLKDVVYDADDVMDEFSYETMRRSVRGNSLKYKARDFVSSANPLAFRFKMAGKIKHINQRLDTVIEDMSRFQLQTTPSSYAIPLGESKEQRIQQTESSINESNIIGRKGDKKKIIDMLTSSSSSSEINPEKVSVVSIVGMGGIGKTTLAQLVYNDELVNQQFKLKMWIHVSEDFDVEKLLRKIMESSTQSKFDTLSNFDVLASKVREQLNGKKYLLVLDDLWNERDELWERLCSPLLVGAQGSKILITTRKSQVADTVKGIIPPYKLEELQNKECWSIIEKNAFSPGGALKTTNMTSIGVEIAKKCGGLPLAAKFLGSLMRTRNKDADWLSIQENHVWNTPENENRVIATLKLSYDDLASQLKQCFSYCCIFPKGWEIDRKTLVRLWIAEGFLDTCKVGKGRSIEDIGDEYFESLVWSSFLERGIIKNFKMHDLVHDLAQAVAGDQELVSLKVSDSKSTSEIRRLQLILDVDLSLTFLKCLTKAKKLRTLFIPEGSNVYPDILLGNQHLRVLHIGRSPDWTFPKLPSLRFKVKHLRYLHLSSLDIREVVNDLFPVNELYHLETLVLHHMIGSIENLLTNIQSLKKLRHLDISETNIEELPDSVTSLCHLQTLDLNYCKLNSLPKSASGLKNLRLLDISHNLIEELPGFISNLGNLQSLNIEFCDKLKSLPGSVKGLTNLKIFKFDYCPLLEKLPDDFGTLTQLTHLSLYRTGIKVLPESCVNLINLEDVDLFHCELPKELDHWKNLSKFSSTKKVTPVGVGKLVSLEDLTYWVREKLINGDDHNYNGIEELGNLNVLRRLGIMNLQNVKDPMDAERANLKEKQNLYQLELGWDEAGESSDMLWDLRSCNFQVFEALRPHIGLNHLEIHNFMGRDLPTWMCMQFKHLTFLRLTGLKSLKSLDIGGFPCLTNLFLFYMFSLEDLYSSHSCLYVRVLWISGSKKLTEIPLFPSLKMLTLQDIDHRLVRSVAETQTSLIMLYLENIKELNYFPISILHKNCNLRNLNIEECSKFQGFRADEDQENENGDVTLLSAQLHSGCSLGELVLSDCPVLKFLPDLQGWTSLRKLVIQNCPRVKEYLTYDLKTLSFLRLLDVDFIERDEEPFDLCNSMELAMSQFRRQRRKDRLSS